MNDDSRAPLQPLSGAHPVVAWVRGEVLPKLIEDLRPVAVVVFDPPDRPASIGGHPPGLLVVSEVFRGVPMPERLARVRHLLGSIAPVRPFCLTPDEHRLAAFAPGPVLAALRTGVSLL